MRAPIKNTNDYDNQITIYDNLQHLFYWFVFSAPKTNILQHIEAKVRAQYARGEEQGKR